MKRKTRQQRMMLDPVEQARLEAERRHDPGKWGLGKAALALPANGDVLVEGDTRRNTARAQRYDVFALMFFHPRPRMTAAAYDAVRRLQRDIAILHRTGGASDAIRTIGDGRSWLTEGMSHARIEAGERVRAAVDGMSRLWTRRLILALCESEAVGGSAPNWQAITEQVTGETERRPRAARVLEACADLASAYVAIDAQPRHARSLAFA